MHTAVPALEYYGSRSSHLNVNTARPVASVQSARVLHAYAILLQLLYGHMNAHSISLTDVSCNGLVHSKDVVNEMQQLSGHQEQKEANLNFHVLYLQNTLDRTQGKNRLISKSRHASKGRDALCYAVADWPTRSPRATRQAGLARRVFSSPSTS